MNEIPGFLLDKGLVELMRRESLSCNPHSDLDKILNLVGIATQAPDGMMRVNALSKLKEIDSDIKICQYDSKIYFHGWTKGIYFLDFYFEASNNSIIF